MDIFNYRGVRKSKGSLMVVQRDRRNFLKGGTAIMTGALLSRPTISQASINSHMAVIADLPHARSPRVVVVGAGTAGLTIAKYLKRENPKFDVVVVEKRDMYASCFSSNLWYDDLVNLEFLAAHSFLDAAKENGYMFFNATCIGLDRSVRKVYTNQGYINYEFLVLTPGIDYDYSRIGVTDIDTEMTLRIDYPVVS